MFNMTVDKSDEFYLAIAKDVEGHSFLFAGVQSNGKNHLLARVGKGRANHDRVCQFIFKFAFSSLKGELFDEGISRRKGRRHAINYVAYTINYQQYLDFISLLQQIQGKKIQKSYECFKPVEENGTQVTLTYTDETTVLTRPIVPKPAADEIIEQMETLHCTNTCRHSALSLVNYVLDDKQATQNVSKQFFNDLPYQTTLVADDGDEFEKVIREKKVVHQFVRPTPEIPFYILPAPPSSFKNLAPLKLKVMTELYQQLEKMLHIAPESQETAYKFSLLKNLYNEKMGLNEESLSDFIASVGEWRNRYRQELKTLRKTYFFDRYCTRQTATEKMFSRFDEYFAKTEPKP
ncbi:hypothetical protein [Legionella clemsonensis]|uniref:Uncharacterized protein n=1 Tax=Legionella clemsonensis TaxID=1867846 RepID=A0A222P508_9GAMM|nr:hypothetical protein [Legionella clemsonensis]ASQ46907.1 hypothetical protein clem_11850 [Legionella clemsonensis]